MSATIETMPDWQVQSARLTFFVGPDAVIPHGIWQQVIGEPPETSVAQRTDSARHESGPFADGVLGIRVLPSRVDWVHEAPVNPLTPSVDALGPVAPCTEPLLTASHRWAGSPSFPSVLRLAFGLVLISSVRDRSAGYDELRAFVNGVPNDPRASDFSYQVNLPARSTVVDTLNVNRLSKWSVGGFRNIALDAASATAVLGDMHFHLRLELDINTDPAFAAELPRDRVMGILTELPGYATQIITNGARY